MMEEIDLSLIALSKKTKISYFKPIPVNGLRYKYTNMQMRFLTPASLPENGKQVCTNNDAAFQCIFPFNILLHPMDLICYH